jgi:uncharacterized peroxidase-related enzyme
MSRMIPPAEDDVPAASRPGLDSAADQLGFVPNMHRGLAAAPKAFNAWLGLRKAMSTALDAATRQGIAHAIDEVNGCRYCDAMHTWVSEQMTRLDDGEIARNRNGSSSDTRRAAALAFAREVALTRGNVDDSALDAVRGAGFTDGQILEIVGVVVLSTMSNYFNNVMETDVDAFPTGAFNPPRSTACADPSTESSG